MTTYIADVSIHLREDPIGYISATTPIEEFSRYISFAYTVRVEEEPGTPIQELVLEEALALAMLVER